MARANLLPVLAGHDGIRLVALVDRAEARARELAGAYQVPTVLTDLGTLAQDEVDGVILATPPAHHAPAAIELAARGLHVFVEKPMATTLADARAMVEAAERAGVVLGVGLYRRFLPSVRLLRHLVETQAYGAPLAIDIEEGGPYGWQLASLEGLTRAGAGGGVLIDIGSHLIDELLFVLPGRARLDSFQDNSRGGIETDCLVHCDLETSHGHLPVRMELSRTRELGNSIRIECEDATLELRRPDFTQVLVHRQTSDSPSSPTAAPIEVTATWPGQREFVGYQAFRDEIDDWLDGITEGREPVLSGRSVLPVVELIEECYERRTDLPEPWTDEGLGLPDRPSIRRPRRVLVTGAGGFLGGRTVEILRERHGWDVVPLVRRAASAARLARWPGEIVVGDVCSPGDMARVLTGCDAVVHCAVGTDWPPEAARKTTVEGTRTLAQAALQAGVKRLVHISTLNVHRRDLGGVLDETTPLEPPEGDRYGRSKLEAEQAVEVAARQGLSVVVLRPTRIYGPFSKTFTVRPLQALATGRFALSGDPDVPANMVYVDNVVEAIARALDAPAAASGKAFLVTDPEQVTLREFYAFFARAVGRDVLIVPAATGESDDRRPGFVSRWATGLASIARSPEFRGLARKVIYTDPIGTWPRRVWDRSPALQAGLLRRFGSNPAVVYRPAPPVGEGRLIYFGESARVSSARAEASLGYRGEVSRAAAMDLTLAWARHARLADAEDR